MVKLSSIIGKYEVDLGDGEAKVALDVDAMLYIGQDLSAEFTNQASTYAYVATLGAMAEAMWLESKKELERTYAEMDKDVRRDLITSGEKITEGKVKEEIKTRRGYHEALLEELDFREQHLIMQALVRAFDMRAQMLISLGAHLRAEAQQTGMTIGRTAKEELTAISRASQVAKGAAETSYAEAQHQQAQEVEEDDEDDIPF